MKDMQMAGFTFSMDRIGQILQEIERRKATAKDFIGDTRQVRAMAVDGEFTLKFQGNQADLYGFTKNGRNQLAEAVGIPRNFFNRMADDAKHKSELATLVNHFFQAEPDRRLFRTLDGKVRATLTPSFKALDNADFFFLAAEEFKKAGAEIWEARLTDDSFRLYAVAEGISGEVRENVIDGTHWRPEDGGTPEQRAGSADRHVAAVALENSETGNGKLKVRPCTLRRICANWNVWHDELAVMHLGKKRAEAGWISADTNKLEDRVTWSKVRDVIKTAFDPKRFAAVIDGLNNAKSDAVIDPVEAVNAAVSFCELPESSIEAIRNKFLHGKDFSRYGLVQAVTWQTHDAETDEAKDAYDDAGSRLLGANMKKVLASL